MAKKRKVPKLDKYYKDIEKASVKLFVSTARDALYEFPNIKLDDIETLLHYACLKLETMQAEIDKLKK